MNIPKTEDYHIDSENLIFSITQDYAKAIQEERKLLIKAMYKAKKQAQQAKVIDRNLWIGDSKFSDENIPNAYLSTTVNISCQY